MLSSVRMHLSGANSNWKVLVAGIWTLTLPFEGGSFAAGSSGRATSKESLPANATPKVARTDTQEARGDNPPPLTLAFSDLLLPGPGLVPSARTFAAAGKQVRLIGFMVRMEVPSPHAFYLTSKPLICDEAGGGTADLPPDAVRVVVPWAKSNSIPFVAGPVEVIGTFDVSNREEEDGRTSTFRITLDSRLNRSVEKASISR